MVGKAGEIKWNKAKRLAFASGRLQTVHVRSGGREKLCLQLVDAPPSKPFPIQARHPAARALDIVRQAGGDGVLSVDLRDAMVCHASQFQRIPRVLEKVGVRRQREIYGRGNAFRYLWEGEGGGGVNRERGERGASKQAKEEEEEEAECKKEGEGGRREAEGGGTVQHEQRLAWAMELVRADGCTTELALRVWLNLCHRKANNAHRIDSKTITRLVAQMDRGEVAVFQVPRPQHWRQCLQHSLTILAVAGERLTIRPLSPPLHSPPPLPCPPLTCPPLPSPP